MAYDFKQLQESVIATEEWLKKEFFTIRTGRATPQVLDSIRVDSYGTKVPLNQVANIGIEDARTLRISPYDASSSKEIEKAIVDSGLGLSVSSDDRGVRVSFPELTAESRGSLVKVIKEKLEQARVSLRKERDEVWNDIQAKEKTGEVTEDEKFKYKDDMQKIVDEGNKALDDLAARKEEELKG